MSQKISNDISKFRIEGGRDFSKFRKFYFRRYNELPDGMFQRDLVELLSRMIHKRGFRVAIAAPRDSAKSTIITLQYVLHSICYNLEKFIVIVSNTKDQAINHLGKIKAELEGKNELLVKDFPSICETGKKPGPPRWTQSEIITRNGIKVLSLSVGQKIRGRSNRESRPSLIVCDDIEPDESFQNPDSYEKLYNWLTKALLKSGTNNTNVVIAGTIHHYGSLLAQVTSRDSFPGWEKKIYRSVLSWSDRPELWERWTRIYNYHDRYKGTEGPMAAEQFFKDNAKTMLKGTKVLWPDRKSYYDLMVLREQDGHYSFDSEMQNEPINPKDCTFDVESSHYWDDRFSLEEELLGTLRLEFYGACDPSVGKQGRRGDYSAIITVARDLDKGTIYVIDADIAKRPLDKLIEDILAYCQKRQYRKFLFESNQFQDFAAQQLIDTGNKRGIYPKIERIKNTTDKIARIEALQPLIKNGTIQFSKNHRELLNQMKCFPKGAHDDGLDALEMAVKACHSIGGSGFEIVSSDKPFSFFTEYDNDPIEEY